MKYRDTKMISECGDGRTSMPISLKMMSINIDDPYPTRIGVFAMFPFGLIKSSVQLCCGRVWCSVQLCITVCSRVIYGRQNKIYQTTSRFMIDRQSQSL